MLTFVLLKLGITGVASGLGAYLGTKVYNRVSGFDKRLEEETMRAIAESNKWRDNVIAQIESDKQDFINRWKHL